MKYQFSKDKRKRICTKKQELKRLVLKYRMRQSRFQKKWFIHASLSKYLSKGSKTRFKNRCLLTGRGRSVYRPFRLSRIVLRELVSLGMVSGMRKSSW